MSEKKEGPEQGEHSPGLSIEKEKGPHWLVCLAGSEHCSDKSHKVADKRSPPGLGEGCCYTERTPSEVIEAEALSSYGAHFFCLGSGRPVGAFDFVFLSTNTHLINI